MLGARVEHMAIRLLTVSRFAGSSNSIAMATEHEIFERRRSHLTQRPHPRPPNTVALMPSHRSLHLPPSQTILGPEEATSSTSSSLITLTKMPYAGRGGAGNIQAVEEANKRGVEDLEANHQATETFTSQPAPTSDEQYARVGRGGAGNFYNRQDANDTDRVGFGDGINSLGSGPILTSRKTTVSEPEPGPTRNFGRGGAGNFSFDSSENQDRALRMRLEEDEQKKQQVKEQVEKGVEETLAMPPKAKLPREMPDP